MGSSNLQTCFPSTPLSPRFSLLLCLSHQGHSPSSSDDTHLGDVVENQPFVSVWRMLSLTCQRTYFAWWERMLFPIPPCCKQAARSGLTLGMNIAYSGWQKVSWADDTVFNVLAAFTALLSHGRCFYQTMQIKVICLWAPNREALTWCLQKLNSAFTQLTSTWVHKELAMVRTRRGLWECAICFWPKHKDALR